MVNILSSVHGFSNFIVNNNKVLIIMKMLHVHVSKSCPD